MDRFSEYRIMWVLVFFDLPTDTKKERKNAALFRKRLIEDGFVMFQFSIYMRHCLPDYGQVGILCITDKQFSNMELFSEHKPKESEDIYIQLELF